VLHASDVTPGDVDALAAFLRARLDDLRHVHTYDSADYLPARALETAVFNLLYNMRQVFEVDDGSQQMLRARRRHWNQLCQVMAPWRETEGYDTARWQEVNYIDPQEAAEMAEHRAKRDAERAAYRRERLAML
jgi:hypothetical protein